jgi:hypothetical protein
MGGPWRNRGTNSTQRWGIRWLMGKEKWAQFTEGWRQGHIGEAHGLPRVVLPELGRCRDPRCATDMCAHMHTRYSTNSSTTCSQKLIYPHRHVCPTFLWKYCTAHVPSEAMVTGAPTNTDMSFTQHTNMHK